MMAVLSVSRMRRAALAPTHNPEFESAKLSQTVGDFIVQRIHEWGVRTIFG
jgi:hypothetical protein